MIQSVQKILDTGFLIGLVFALFLAGRIVPYLIVVGVLPIIFFWSRSHYTSSTISPKRLFIPTLSYLAFAVGLYYLYPGLPSGMTPPGNPDLELYAVALALLLVGYFRGSQINNLANLFHAVVPYALIVAFLVLAAYMFLGIDGCRVYVAASWPFIPAIIFSTLTFLSLLDWRNRTANEKRLRYGLIALSIVVILGFTAARGVAIGLFTVLFSIILLGLLPRLRAGLPSARGLLLSIFIGLTLTFSVSSFTGCNNIDRWPAIFDTIIKRANATPLVALKTDASESGQVTGSDSLNEHIGQSTIKAAAAPEDEAISQRVGMWAASLEAIQASPIIGHGALSLKPIIQEPFGYEHNHNQYLAWLVTGGTIFLSFGMIFICTPLFMGKALMPADKVLAVLSVTVLWGISMIFDAFLNLDFYLHYFSLLLGFLFALFKNMSSMSKSSGKQA
jgi:hypothetical protein